MKKLILILMLALIVTANCAYGQIPHLMSYQGRLTDIEGIPVPDGIYSATFRVYNTSTGGSPLWYNTRSVTVSDGIFEVLLGEAKVLDLPFDNQYYLAIQVGSTPEMTPRQKLSSSGYAYSARTADDAAKVGGIEASATPEANKLVALDENAKVPVSVIPDGLKIKAWANFNGSGGTSMRDSYNIANVVRNSSGDYTITWATPFASAGYAVIATHKLNTPSQTHIVAQTAGSVRIRITQDGSSSSMDSDSVSLMAMGTQ
jgi:hypothetical protein